MLKGRKLVAVLLTFVMVMASMVTGFAGIQYGAPTANTSSSSTTFFGSLSSNTQNYSYQLKVTPSSTSVGSVIYPEIQVLDANGNVLQGQKLIDYINSHTITLNTNGALAVNSNNVTVPNFTYKADLNTISTVSSAVYGAQLEINFNRDGIGLFANNYQSVPVLVQNYGQIDVSAVNTTNNTNDTLGAQIALGTVQPSIYFLSGDSKALESYPETAVVTIPNLYQNYQNLKAKLYEINSNNTKTLFATIDLQANAIGNYNGYFGYKVVLPPLSSANTYSLEVTAPVSTYYFNNGVQATNSYYVTGSVAVPVQAATKTLVAPTPNSDNVLALAAGINDTVKFTLNDKLPNGNTASDGSYLSLVKFVRLTVLKSDNSTKDTSVNVNNALSYIDANHNYVNGGWYEVTSSGLVPVKADGTIDTTTAISGSYDSTTGTITLANVNIPNGDYLKVEGAYTNYLENGYEPTYTSYERTFTIADLQAKLGTITADKTALNADEYQIVKFTVKDIHGNPISGTTIAFSAPVAFLGGTGSSYGNIASNTATTDSKGQVEVPIYSAFPASITVSDSGVANSLTLTVGNATKSTVVFTPGSTTYTVNGVAKTADAAPYITSTGRTVVPARFLADALGVQSYFDYSADGHSVVTFVKGTTVVKFVLGTNQVTITKNGVTVTDTMDVTATVNDQNGKPVGRTYIPARYLAEAFGYTVNYDATTGNVTITNAQ